MREEDGVYIIGNVGLGTWIMAAIETMLYSDFQEGTAGKMTAEE